MDDLARAARARLAGLTVETAYWASSTARLNDPIQKMYYYMLLIFWIHAKSFVIEYT